MRARRAQPLSAAPSAAAARRVNWIGRLTLYSVTLTLIAASAGALTSVLWLASPLRSNDIFIAVHAAALWFLLMAGLAAFFMLFGAQRWLVPRRNTTFSSLAGARVHVALTAFNDEACIAEAVGEFKAHPSVGRLIVVDNDSTDQTRGQAREAGADLVVVETSRGYGACCMRALEEAADGADVVVLCEGDLTFSAQDLPKFLAYLENCDMVLGTRATQELRETDTQMDWLINPANQVVAKLIQTRFWGVRLTDVGCTYRAMRVDSYKRLREHLHVRGNHFSPHMYMEALKLGMRVIEIPVVFRRRGGLSKGVGANKVKAAGVALRMLGLLYRI